MIFILEIIYCGVLAFDENIRDVVYDTESGNYVSTVSSQRASDFLTCENLKVKKNKMEYIGDDLANVLDPSLEFTQDINILDFYDDICDSSKIKNEMDIYFPNNDIELIEIDNNSKNTHIDKPKLIFYTYKTSQLAKDTINKTTFDVKNIEKCFLECKKKIQNFKEEMDRKAPPKKEESMGINLPLQVHKDAWKSYGKIIDIYIGSISKLRKLQLPEIKKKLRKSQAPSNVQNIIYEFIKIFSSFLDIYDMKLKYLPSNLSNKHRMKIYKYNIELFSLFDHIPISKLFKVLKTDLKKIKYGNFDVQIKIDKIFNSMQKKLIKLSSRSNSVINIYKKLILILNQ
ncbi:uncharacterized protein VNE69_02240 [Vairimorpha necatrix]|uniref:Uncharacterized protein n=1 Tax=Vairimorpha necatrix TaxID=6039 RepID=A0AAX4J9T4_9MICR